MLKNFVQVGFTAQRKINGDFLPAMPVYILADFLENSGLAITEEKALCDISGLAFKRYKEKKVKETFNYETTNNNNVQG